MSTIPVVPARASAYEVATIIEDQYGVPRELLDELASRVAMLAGDVASSALSEWDTTDWLQS